MHLAYYGMYYRLLKATITLVLSNVYSQQLSLVRTGPVMPPKSELITVALSQIFSPDTDISP